MFGVPDTEITYLHYLMDLRHQIFLWRIIAMNKNEFLVVEAINMDLAPQTEHEG